MYYITYKRMKTNNQFETNLLEIDELFLDGQGWYKKEILYDFLVNNPKTIKVKNCNGPFVLPAKSIYGEKYVRSEPNTATFDNLLELPNG